MCASCVLCLEMCRNTDVLKTHCYLLGIDKVWEVSKVLVELLDERISAIKLNFKTSSIHSPRIPSLENRTKPMHTEECQYLFVAQMMPNLVSQLLI